MATDTTTTSPATTATPVTLAPPPASAPPATPTIADVARVAAAIDAKASEPAKPRERRPEDEDTTSPTVEAHAKVKATEPWFFAAAKSLGRWPVGLRLSEAHYDKAIAAAKGLTIHGTAHGAELHAKNAAAKAST